MPESRLARIFRYGRVEAMQFSNDDEDAILQRRRTFLLGTAGALAL